MFWMLLRQCGEFNLERMMFSAAELQEDDDLPVPVLRFFAGRDGLQHGKERRDADSSADQDHGRFLRHIQREIAVRRFEVNQFSLRQTAVNMPAGFAKGEFWAVGRGRNFLDRAAVVVLARSMREGIAADDGPHFTGNAERRA